MGTSFRDVFDGTETVLNSLALGSGVSAAELLLHSIRRTARNSFVLQGVELPLAALERTNIRACPLCIQEDVGLGRDAWAPVAYGRGWWQISSLRTCAIHRCALVDIGHESKPERAHDFTLVSRSALGRLPEIATAASKREASPLERYLQARLDSRDGSNAFLDALPFYVVAKTSEAIGAVDIFGRDVSFRSLSGEDWWQAGCAGFAILSAGPSGLGAWLASQRDNYPRRHTLTQKAQAYFGSFMGWLRAAPDSFDPIRDIVAEHCFSTMPLEPGSIVCGRVLAKRRIYSVYTASRATGRVARPLRKMLVEIGVVDERPDLRDHELLFPADESTEAFLAKAANCLSLKATQAYLGITRTHVVSFLAHGLIRPFQRPTTDISSFSFEQGHIEELRRTVLSKANLFERLNPDVSWVNVMQASRRANCSLAEVVQLILSDRLSNIRRLRSAASLLEIEVNLIEVKDLVRGSTLPGVTKSCLKQRLRISDEAMRKFLSTGVLQTIDARHPVKRQSIKVVPYNTLETFEREYVLLTALARQLCISPRTLKIGLDRTGIGPVFTFGLNGVDAYKRTDIEKLRGVEINFRTGRSNVRMDKYGDKAVVF
ncbi:UNVERIFIED_ORG: hypothetical protein J2W75_004840 [Methylorubrum zatmanii]|nr:hypothetical protein [Methylorubrum extorquens]